MEDRNEHPVEKCERGKLSPLLDSFVENGVFKSYLFGYVLIQDKRKDWKHRKESGVAKKKKAVINWESHEVVLHAEYCLHDRYDSSSVNYELGEKGTSFVGKSSMPVNQRVQIAKLLY